MTTEERHVEEIGIVDLLTEILEHDLDLERWAGFETNCSYQKQDGTRYTLREKELVQAAARMIRGWAHSKIQ